MTSVSYRYDNDWVYFSIDKDGEKLPVDEWSNLSNSKFFNAISYLLSSIQETDDPEKDGKILENENEIRISHSLVSQISDKDDENLNLPPKIPYILDLRHFGILSSSDFHLTATWNDF